MTSWGGHDVAIRNGIEGKEGANSANTRAKPAATAVETVVAPSVEMPAEAMPCFVDIDDRRHSLYISTQIPTTACVSSNPRGTSDNEIIVTTSNQNERIALSDRTAILRSYEITVNVRINLLFSGISFRWKFLLCGIRSDGISFEISCRPGHVLRSKW